ncbi:MAG TPA: hypothetical protein VE778_00775 [Candidatus Bathyarchaeia archaeon]|jgi:hypothetical protein|nr:hypothetical protein [Candidatus Bathyarchaeia archaeon]
MKTIKDVEGQVEEKVSEALRELELLPEGYRCSVRLHGKERDKRRTATFETSWSPDTDSIHIRFERSEEKLPAGAEPVAPNSGVIAPNHAAKSSDSSNNPLSDLIRALDRVESRPGYEFVALKWFRDTALPSEGFSWANEDFARQNVLREAIDRRLILTSKVPNPRSPQFPVTAIRLNRLMPEVKEVLGTRDESLVDFQPVAIRGENLSATVLRDRR